MLGRHVELGADLLGVGQSGHTSAASTARRHGDGGLTTEGREANVEELVAVLGVGDEAEVAHPNLALERNEDVGGFEVAVNEVVAVDERDCVRHLRKIHSTSFLTRLH